LAQLVEFIGNHYILVAIFVVVLIALAINESLRAGRAISTSELTALLNSGKACVLDVRPAKEFSTGHIAGSVNIAHDKLDARFSELNKHQDKTIIVVDTNGMHLAGICTKLLQAKFNAVKLVGGISTWRAENLPLTKK